MRPPHRQKREGLRLAKGKGLDPAASARRGGASRTQWALPESSSDMPGAGAGRRSSFPGGQDLEPMTTGSCPLPGLPRLISEMCAGFGARPAPPYPRESQSQEPRFGLLWADPRDTSEGSPDSPLGLAQLSRVQAQALASVTLVSSRSIPTWGSQTNEAANGAGGGALNSPAFLPTSFLSVNRILFISRSLLL